MSSCLRSRSWLVTILFVCCTVVLGESITLAGEAAPLSDGLATKVDQLFAEWSQTDLPGCSVGIVRDGELVYAKGFGTANLDYEVPNSPRTVFEIGSFSKAFTSACIALLMDQGKVAPDDDIRKFVPEMHKFDPPIRVRHLVRCRSGLWAQFHILPLVGWDNLPIHHVYTKEDVLAIISGQKRLPFEPGTQFQYGSGDYFLLGMIVERASGKTLARFAKENLFEPLGMTRSFIEHDPSLVVKQRAVGHYKDHETKAWRLWTNHGYLPGGSGVKTCVEDLARWDRNFDENKLPPGKYTDEFFTQGALLGNRYCLDMDAYRVAAASDELRNEVVVKYRGAERMLFTGGVFGMSSALLRFPEQRLTIICLSNNDDIAPWKKAKQIADLTLAGELDPVDADRPKKPAFVEVPKSELENKVGAYRSEGGHVFQITVKDGKLWNTNHRRETYLLKPYSANRFLPTAYPSDTIAFERESPKERFTLKVETTGGATPFHPVDLVDPADLKVSDYVGRYHSDELSATYQFAERENGLWLRVNSRRWERLDPTIRDQFVAHVRHPHDARFIQFRRENGQVSGFTIAMWRVKGVEFNKQ